jgi:hypothetical protein
VEQSEGEKEDFVEFCKVGVAVVPHSVEVMPVPYIIGMTRIKEAII